MNEEVVCVMYIVYVWQGESLDVQTTVRFLSRGGDSCMNGNATEETARIISINNKCIIYLNIVMHIFHVRNVYLFYSLLCVAKVEKYYLKFYCVLCYITV